MIKSEDISVIVQGAVNKEETPKCLKSIRKFLPNAQIILSTWIGENIEHLDYDEVILNDIPETAFIKKIRFKDAYNNLNKQLFSTQEGLKKANRKYAMKLRSDLILTSDKFLEYFDKFQKRGDEYNLFERKILTCTLFTRFMIKNRFNERIYIPFHISDWWFFGLKEDIDKYFTDTPLVKEPEFTNYFAMEENKSKKNPYNKVNFKFAPEQYFGYMCFKRNFDDIYMEDAADYNDEIMEKSRKCLVNNFIILEFEQSGIYLDKYFFSKNEKLSGEQYIDLYGFYRYECEYKKYCDNDYQITSDNFLQNNKDYGYSLLRLKKHIAILKNNKAPISQRLEQLFIGIPISCINYLIIVIKENLRNKKDVKAN